MLQGEEQVPCHTWLINRRPDEYRFAPLGAHFGKSNTVTVWTQEEAQDIGYIKCLRCQQCVSKENTATRNVGLVLRGADLFARIPETFRSLPRRIATGHIFARRQDPTPFKYGVGPSIARHFMCSSLPWHRSCFVWNGLLVGSSLEDAGSCAEASSTHSENPLGRNKLFSPDALAGRVAMITGGGSGIGFAIARTFAEAGARLVLASRNIERLNSAVAEIKAGGGEVVAVATDVRSYEAVENAVKVAVDTFGSLDIMIANAAGNFVVPAATMSANAWKVVVDIDLNGTFYCARAAYEALRASEFGGRLIAISTTRALEGWPGCAHAGAAKAGIVSLIRTLSSEWGADGIRCNTIAPGAIGDTEGTKRIYKDQGRAERERSSIPLGTFGQTADIANAALYLCSDAGSYITGADLVVDGGRNRSRAGTGLPVSPAGKEAAE
jgi:NAD(P)-dependent dehydrogenase (short-subunit alcohol dehydrogenase family)